MLPLPSEPPDRTGRDEASHKGKEGQWCKLHFREHGIRPREVEQLLDVYGVSDAAVREPILELAARAWERDWRSTRPSRSGRWAARR